MGDRQKKREDKNKKGQDNKKEWRKIQGDKLGGSELSINTLYYINMSAVCEEILPFTIYWKWPRVLF